MFFCDRVVCAPLIPSQKNEKIIESEDCHDMHVLYMESMEMYGNF